MIFLTYFQVLIFKFFATISFLFILGYLILRFLNYKLKFYETFFTSIVLGIILLTLIATYLSFTPFHISKLSGIIAIFIFCLIMSALTNRKCLNENKILFDEIKKEKITLIILILILVIPLISRIENIAAHKYFLGYDPFTTKPCVNAILTKKLNPIQFATDSVNFFGQFQTGFYYFICILKKISGINEYLLTRYGGPILLGLAGVLLFLILANIFNSKIAGSISALIFIGSPFVVDRFSMLVRENFAFIFFLNFIFFFCLDQIKPQKNIVLSLILAGVIASHILVSIFLLGTIVFSWSYKVISSMSYKKNMFTHFKELSLLIFISFLISFPFSVFFIQSTLETLLIQFSKIGLLNVTERWEIWYWNREIIWSNDFSLIGFILAPIGVLYLIHKKEYSSIITLLGPTIISLLLFFLTKKGFPLPVVRLIIYIALGLAILGGIGAKMITKRLFLEKNFLMLFLIFLLIITTVYTTTNYNKWSPFEENQMKGAQYLAHLVEEKPGIVFSDYSEVVLLLYANVKNVETNRPFLIQIFYSDSISDLRKLILSKYPNSKIVYFFISKRFVNNAFFKKAYGVEFKLKKILEDNTIKLNKKGAYIYILEVKNSAFTNNYKNTRQFNL